MVVLLFMKNVNYYKQDDIIVGERVNTEDISETSVQVYVVYAEHHATFKTAHSAQLYKLSSTFNAGVVKCHRDIVTVNDY